MCVFYIYIILHLVYLWLIPWDSYFCRRVVCVCIRIYIRQEVELAGSTSAHWNILLLSTFSLFSMSLYQGVSVFVDECQVLVTMVVGVSP